MDFSAMDFEEILPPGFRFCPTDEELIGYYLPRQVAGTPTDNCPIVQKDVYAREKPWEIFEFVSGHSIHGNDDDNDDGDDDDDKDGDDGEEAVYVFSSLKKKYPTATKCDRKILGGGFWKMTGAGKDIKGIGQKDTFNYKEHGPGQNQTGWNWIMHQFTLYPPGSTTLALCRIKKGRRTTESTSSKKPMMNQTINNANANALDAQNNNLKCKKRAKLSSSMYTSEASTSGSCHESFQAYGNLHASTSYSGAPQPEQQMMNHASYYYGNAQQGSWGNMRCASEASTSGSYNEPSLQVHENIHCAVPQAYQSNCGAPQPEPQASTSRSYDKPLQMNENNHRAVHQAHPSYCGAPQPKPQVVNQPYYYDAGADMSQQLMQDTMEDVRSTCDSGTTLAQPTNCAQPHHEENISASTPGSSSQSNDQSNLSNDICMSQPERNDDFDLLDIESIIPDLKEIDFDKLLEGVAVEDFSNELTWDAESINDIPY